MSFIGIDVGGTKILGVRADREGKIATQVRRPTRGSEGLEAVVDRIARMIKDLTPRRGEVEGIGVGIPGPTDPMKGLVYNPPNLPGWGSVPLRDMLRERLDLDDDIPLVLVNDANAAGLAEFKFGAGSPKSMRREIKHLVYLTVSTGVGGGVVIDGKLLVGSSGLAAELGHMVIDVSGPRCYCGGIGHLEAMASGTALAREGYMVVASPRKTSMSDAVGGNPDKVTAEVVVQAAQEGDPAACELMEREGFLVGIGVVNCIHTFNPELIVIGGGVSNAGSLLFDPVRATVEAKVMPAYLGTYEIVPAALKGTSGALGAVAAALAES
ncbi:MAG TPA: ROK family protein [Chloroflexia bacterium]|nr:ROK family protein [Chloroflexia bacterium]